MSSHDLTDKAVEGVLKKLRLAKPEDVYADVGRGALRADEVLAAVYPQLKRDPKRKRPSYIEPNTKGVSIAGLTEGIGYRLGGCCHPIPGDRIIGLMVPGEGVVIHTIDCEVLDRHQDSMADWIDVRWKDHVGALSVARIMVRLKNETGALATLANVIGQNGANISNLKITSRNPLYFEFQVDVEVGDAAHLENLIRALKVDSAVEAVERSRGLDTDNQGGSASPSKRRACFPSSARSIDADEPAQAWREHRPRGDAAQRARQSLSRSAARGAKPRLPPAPTSSPRICARTAGTSATRISPRSRRGRSAQSRDGRDRGDARDRACARSRAPAVSFPSGAKR